MAAAAATSGSRAAAASAALPKTSPVDYLLHLPQYHRMWSLTVTPPLSEVQFDRLLLCDGIVPGKVAVYLGGSSKNRADRG